MISISTNAEAIGESVKNTANAVQSIRDDYIKTDEVNDENSVVNNVRKFREEFQKALEDDAIENIIVLIDDLDRCQPDRIIETLEAIKLFLSVEKMTFIIAADENVIQYAIRKKYPPIENYTVNLDKEYIEKNYSIANLYTRTVIKRYRKLFDVLGCTRVLPKGAV